MILTDSHCHLNQIDLTTYENQLDGLLEKAREYGVGYFLCVATDLESVPDIYNIAKNHDNVWISVGVHPNEEVLKEPTVEDLVQLASDPLAIGIGETGLDYYRSPGDLQWQKERFRVHIQAAKKLKKPLIVHSRLAPEDTITILKEEGAQEVGGVMHCFTETWEVALQAMNLNFYISFSGIVTFKNATVLKEVAKKIPLDHLLIETDSPYLAPEPIRGKTNEPAYVRYIAEYLAVLKQQPLEVIAEATTKNFFRLFLKKEF